MDFSCVWGSMISVEKMSMRNSCVRCSRRDTSSRYRCPAPFRRTCVRGFFPRWCPPSGKCRKRGPCACQLSQSSGSFRTWGRSLTVYVVIIATWLTYPTRTISTVMVVSSKVIVPLHPIPPWAAGSGSPGRNGPPGDWAKAPGGRERKGASAVRLRAFVSLSFFDLRADPPKGER